jgi:hypothetical protein
MLTLGIQLGARVRRRNDTGFDAPGAVVRVKGPEVMVFWPDDNFYEVLPVEELEIYGTLPRLAAA